MISKPRGTRDFTPEEMKKRRWLERKMRDVFERYQKMAQLYEEKAAAPWAGSYLDSFKDG